MAAPTDVRVESTSITTATLRWTYPGTSTISVWRSLTSGSGFAEVTSVGTRVDVGTTSYTDTGLSTGTRYFYKLSDDGGSSFSSEVSVVTQTCGAPPAFDSDRILPREGDEVVQSSTFNELARRVETGLVRFINPAGGYCDVCITNGAIVVDCVTYADCENVEIEVTEDINSISLPNCTNAGKILNFIIPPNTTRGIGGWPAGTGFTGDEAFRAPVSGGTDGRTISVNTGLAKASPKSSGSRPGTQRAGSGGGGAGAGGSSCTCVTNGIGALTIKSCNANNSLACNSGAGAGSKSLRVIACGGTPPYTWSNTGSVTLSGTSGTSITVTPPANPGSGVAGTAYWHSFYDCSGCAGGVCTTVGSEQTVLRNCDDSSSGCTTSSFCTNPAASAMTCGCGLGSPGQPGCGTSPQLCGSCGLGVCSTRQAGNGEGRISVVCDQRTGPMIAAGCTPCGLIATGAGTTVTVTDAVGTQTTIVLRP